VLSVLDAVPAKIVPLPNSTGRRSALARWLTAPDNPLTARVMVNRVWQQHFGRGLAANASDFGMLGEKPAHPELLDWLAGCFVREGWSLKKLHRLIVTSAAYRRSSEHPAPQAGKLKDPENRLLWGWQPRRLEAEQIRDAMFAVSGELEPATGGPGVMPEVPRRTIFTRFMRNTRDPLADVFDAPLWFTSAASRDTTTTPVQSLLLANSAGLRARGRAFAARLEQAAPNDIAAQVRLAYRLAFGREAKAAETSAARNFLTRQAAQSDPRRLASGQASFVPGKVPYRDGQAAFLEPESEQMMFRVGESAALPLPGAFTIEAFFGREPYTTWRKKGFVRNLFQTGNKRDPKLPDTPTVAEIMDQYKTPDTGRRLAKAADQLALMIDNADARAEIGDITADRGRRADLPDIEDRLVSIRHAEATGTMQVLPLRLKLAVAVEHLDAVVFAVRDVDPALGVGDDVVEADRRLDAPAGARRLSSMTGSSTALTIGSVKVRSRGS
jgi:hypothetical protein